MWSRSSRFRRRRRNPVALDSVEILTNAVGILGFAVKVSQTVRALPPGTEPEDEIKALVAAHLDEALALSKQIRQDFKD